MRTGPGISLTNLMPAGGAAVTALGTLQSLLTSGTCSIADFTTATGSPLACDDLSTLNQDWLRVSGTDPTVSGSLGLVLAEASTNNIALATAGGTYTFVFSITMASTDTSAIVIATDTNGTVLRVISGNATALPFTTEVDGASVTTRDNAWTAIAIDSEVVVTISGLDQTGLTHLNIGRWGGGSPDASVRRAVVIDEATITGGNYTDAVSNAETWVAE